MKMQMRSAEDASRRTESRKLLPAAHPVTHLDADAARLKMLVEGESSGAKIDRENVAGFIVERDWDGWLRIAIDDGRDGPIGHRQHVRAIPVVVLRDRSIAVIRPA